MKIITINPTEAFLKSSECLAGKLVTYSDKQLEHLQPLAKFVSRYSEYHAPSWQYDIIANAKRIGSRVKTDIPFSHAFIQKLLSSGHHIE